MDFNTLGFYVYSWIREDGSPFYIGKGNGNRAWKKTKHHYPPTDKSRIKINACHLTEQEAFLLETKLIKLFGRKDLDNGILNNRTFGGQGPSGRKMSDETKKKLGEAVRKRLSSPEQRELLSNRAKAQWADPDKRVTLISGLNSRGLKQ